MVIPWVGNTAGGIGFIVTLAAIIGVCMLGAAQRPGGALVIAYLGGSCRDCFVTQRVSPLDSGVLCTVFFLLIPLARP